MAPQLGEVVGAAAIAVVSFALGWFARRAAVWLRSAPAPQSLPASLAAHTVYNVVEISHQGGTRALYRGADARAAKRAYSSAPPSRFPDAHIVLLHGGLERARREAGAL